MCIVVESFVKRIDAVSYTHLDVYKRQQGQDRKGPALFLAADLWYALSGCRSTYAAMDGEWGEMRK